MRDDLLLYYEQELSFLRQMGVEFSDKYPGVARRLMLEPDKCEDPHVERLLEGFAFLAARVHLKIDDEFPELTEALLNILYPHYLRPIPSMSIVQFHLDPENGGLTTPQQIPRESVLNSRRMQSVLCHFRTCFDMNVLPITVTGGEWKTPDRLNPPVRTNDAAGALRLEFRAPKGITFTQLGIKSLRFFISAESYLANTIYELLFANCVQILVRDPSNQRLQPVVLKPEEVLRPVGFAPEECMLPYPRRSFEGYRLLQEYFAFPEKYLFFDISGLDQAWMRGIKDQAEIVFLISPFELSDRRQNLELGVNAKTFKINCCPIINLFKKTADPISLNQRKYEYQVIPDVTRPQATEVFSVEEVISIDTEKNKTTKFEPFYSFRHSSTTAEKISSAQEGKGETFWMAHRRPSARRDDKGIDIYLSMVDLSKRPVKPDAEVLSVRTLCTNRDLPARLPLGNEQGDFELEGSATVKRIVSLMKPTPAVRPPTGKGAFWRLISHLSLNYLTLTDQAPSTVGLGRRTSVEQQRREEEFPGREAFKELLKLYNYAGAAHTEKQIDGILKVHGSRQFARVFSENGIAFARGTRIDLELDEDQFVGGGSLLFATVVEQFLTLYASMNSFTQLSVRTKQRKDLLKEWPPRAGQKVLL